MHQLSNLLSERIASGLRRQSIVDPGRWACAYRVMGKPFAGPWNFRRHPWLEGMHNSDAEINVGQKAAQMGYTETVLNVCFYYIDMHGVDVLYVLPSKTPDASDFSAARFDAALNLSPHLGKLFSNVKNVGHKRAGNTNFYLRGAKSRSGLKSVPVGILILDEKDEMNQDNIPLARERQSGYDINKTWEISTPTIDGFGINETFNISTQNEFFFQCQACSFEGKPRWINLTWPDAIEIVGENFDDPRIHDSYIKCPLCGAKIPHKEKYHWLQGGRWIPQYGEKDIIGWGINQLYSSTPRTSPGNIVWQYYKAKVNPADEQEFFNSKLGIPHIVEGARVTEKDIDSCIGDYTTTKANHSGLVTMGIDVGNYLHFEIDKWHLASQSVDLNSEAKCQVLAVGKVLHFEELDKLMHVFGVKFAVCDMQPERRKAYEFATRFWGVVRLCYYGRGIQGKHIHISSEDETNNELSVTVDRTSWIDLALSRFRSQMIVLPKDIPKEYKDHIKSLVRVYEKDQDSNPIAKYVKAGSDEDHFAHARVYSEIALPLAASLAVSSDIRGSY
ncbi:MAG: phage terminase large subunit family protein [Euryarchaeota archaeon]|nr:phage terminase large subunit family protein [Euryarchaeota archaeon]